MPKRKAVQKTITEFADVNKKAKVKKDDSDSSNKVETSGKVKGKSETSEKKPLNKIDTDFDIIDFKCAKNSSAGNSWNFKISSWNVVSLKSITNKNGMEYVRRESPDVMCFQETKCSEKNAPSESKLPGYHRYFAAGVKEGYAGVALYSKLKPLSVKIGIGHKEHDTEGRVITAEYEDFYLVTAYVPNAGRGLVTLPKRLKWDVAFKGYLKKLDSEKPVILCGDLNVAHNEIDLKNPSTNTKTAGFTQEERDGFTKLLNAGFIDTFRKLYPNKEGAYTYWNYIGNARSRNAGWRLDYFVVSERIMSTVCDSVIRKEVYGSDHCPITLFVALDN
ncbi:Recombination repair protein, putative [Pediculus humanus corporis]|uniref:DNA repair nuclease/redox regulator APEX1 n=1 Tax=Pediculus humanus subsp. corporis TaxID=121224 RepID=E0VA47_PEDHC|nr:Recombination repair protein, putative [Pediculus humanus corporis]EEB10253.1 Recombination repair protein, putative [Pediculus humanus corporis]